MNHTTNPKRKKNAQALRKGMTKEERHLRCCKHRIRQPCGLPPSPQGEGFGWLEYVEE
jgi:hypothetical protein